MYVLEHLLNRLTTTDKVLLWEEVQYGIKLSYTHGERKAEGTLYHSPKKRRFSYVAKPKGDKYLARALEESINEITHGVNSSGSAKNAKPAAKVSDEEKELSNWIDGLNEEGGIEEVLS